MFRDAVNKKTGDLSNSLDKTENSGIAFQAEINTRLKVISNILSVERLEKNNRELEQLHAADSVQEIRLDRLRQDLENFRKEYLSAHNGRHPPVDV